MSKSVGFLPFGVRRASGSILAKYLIILIFAGIKPAQSAKAEALEAVFLGVSSFVFSDGQTDLVFDGLCSRPTIPDLILNRSGTDTERVDTCLSKAKSENVQAVFVAHSHFDHIMDAPYIARKASSLFYGSKQSVTIAQSKGVPASQTKQLRHKVPIEIRPFRVTAFDTGHIKTPLPAFDFRSTREDGWQPPKHPLLYPTGTAFSFLVEHKGTRVLLVPSGRADDGVFSGVRAETLILSVGLLSRQDDVQAAVEKLWRNTVQTIGAHRVHLVHWDDPTSELTENLGYAPPFLDRPKTAIDIIVKLAQKKGVIVHTPQGYERLFFP